MKRCDGCGTDLDDLAARGYLGHACHNPPPSYPPKLRLQNVPPALIRGAARALDEDEHVGRAPYDWRGQRTSLMRHVGGIMRHLLAFADGEDVDRDSPTGKLHLEGIAGRLAIMLDAITRGDYTDDRPGRGSWTPSDTVLKSLSLTPLGKADSVGAAAPSLEPADPGPMVSESASSGVRFPGNGPLDARDHAPGCCSRRGPGCDCGVVRPGLNI